MSNSYEDSLKFWQKEIDDKGVGYVRQRLPQYGGDHQEAGYEIVSKFEGNQSHKRHEELRTLAVKSLDVQRDGNETQTRILWVLVVTIVISVLIAIFD